MTGGVGRGLATSWRIGMSTSIYEGGSRGLVNVDVLLVRGKVFADSGVLEESSVNVAPEKSAAGGSSTSNASSSSHYWDPAQDGGQ